jgi:hypothetical protein
MQASCSAGISKEPDVAKDSQPSRLFGLRRAELAALPTLPWRLSWVCCGVPMPDPGSEPTKRLACIGSGGAGDLRALALSIAVSFALGERGALRSGCGGNGTAALCGMASITAPRMLMLGPYERSP